MRLSFGYPGAALATAAATLLFAAAAAVPASASESHACNGVTEHGFKCTRTTSSTRHVIHLYYLGDHLGKVELRKASGEMEVVVCDDPEDGLSPRLQVRWNTGTNEYRDETGSGPKCSIDRRSAFYWALGIEYRAVVRSANEPGDPLFHATNWYAWG